MKTSIHCGSGALFGGILLGLAEGTLVYLSSSDPTAGRVFPYAAALYGLTGLAFGVLLGIPISISRRILLRPTLEGARAFSFTFFLWAGAFYIARVRVLRDLLEEGARNFGGITPLIATVILAVTAAALGLLTLRRLLSARHRVLSPIPAVGSLILVVAIGGVLTREGRPEVTPPQAKIEREAPGDKPNVILIAVDTLRADHVSAYARLLGRSAAPAATPAMDRLAADGAVFLNAISQSSWTKPSFASLLTGLYPSTHNAVLKLDRLPDKVETLAEVLSSGGYLTAALANNANIAPTFNFQQGFAHYRYLKLDAPLWAPEAGFHLVFHRTFRAIHGRLLGGGKRPRDYYWPAEDVNREAFDRIEKIANRRFFLMIHYMDPHDPYFSRPLDGRFYARIQNPRPDPSLDNPYADFYAREVRYLDTHIGKLIEYLKVRGLYDDSLIILTSDHGEEFFEHNGWWHGTSLFEEQVRVPLIIKFPKGENAGKVHRGVVRLLDVPQTVLEVTRTPGGGKMQGRSLVKAALNGAGKEGASALSELNLEGHVLSSLRTSRWKWISANPGNPRKLPAKTLYDLKNDPGEFENLVVKKEPVAHELDRKLRGLIDMARKGAVPRETVTLDPAEEERLRALGYID
ncbi:MAG: sulfatase [Nitrospinota bacterium]|nr:sulfatase [Nitrospinota bacterium]HJM43621.1 sulfatase [Nitrospinota bacterium]